MISLSLWSVVLFVVLASPLNAQADAKPLPIDEATINAVTDACLKQLDEYYVYPETAAKMAKLIRQRQADKAYAQIKTGQELAEVLTKDLREISHDKHLQIWCNTEKRKGPGPRKEPTPEMKAWMKRHAERSNAHYRRVERLAGNVGYLVVDAFLNAEAADRAVAAAMSFLTHTDALIIDLRENTGGDPEGVALLCSYFFDEKPRLFNTLYWRKENRTEEYWTRKELTGPRYLGKKVFVLTSPRTFSGGEGCAYGLQSQKRATIVGERTGGGAHPGMGVPLNDHFLMFVTAGRAINPITKTNWEGTGVKPDVEVPAEQALKKAHALAVEQLLRKAGSAEERRQLQKEFEEEQKASRP